MAEAGLWNRPARGLERELCDSLPVRTTLWIAFAVGAIGAVIMFIGTRKRK